MQLGNWTQDILTPQLYRRDIIYTQSRNFTYHLVVSTLNHNVDYYTPLIIKRFLIITLLSSNFPDTNYSNYLSLCYFQLCYFFNNTGEAIIIHMLCPTFLVFSYNCCLFLFQTNYGFSTFIYYQMRIIISVHFYLPLHVQLVLS